MKEKKFIRVEKLIGEKKIDEAQFELSRLGSEFHKNPEYLYLRGKVFYLNNLKGKVKFSQQFYKKDFPILNLLLSGKQKDPQGNFNFTVRGSLMVPNFKIR